MIMSINRYSLTEGRTWNSSNILRKSLQHMKDDMRVCKYKLYNTTKGKKKIIVHIGVFFYSNSTISQKKERRVICKLDVYNLVYSFHNEKNQEYVIVFRNH